MQRQPAAGGLLDTDMLDSVPGSRAVSPSQGSPPTRTEERLLTVWRDLFANAAIGPDDDFFVLGGYSLLVTRLMGRVAQEFGVVVPLPQIFETPTVRELAAFIDQARLPGGKRRAVTRSLVPIQPNGARPPLFCAHPIGGGAFCYQLLADYLGPDQPVYGLQARGLLPGEQPQSSIPEMAAAYLQEVRLVQAEGPYHVLGYSLGGLIAFEMAQQLRAAGAEVALLALVDTGVPRDFSIAGARWQYLRHVGRRVPYHLRRVLTQTPGEMVQYLGTRTRVFAWQMGRFWMRGLVRVVHAARPQADASTTLSRQIESVTRACGQAAHDYRPAVYGGAVLYFGSLPAGPSIGKDHPKAWAALARGGLDLHVVGGDHSTMLDDPQVGKIAFLIQQTLGAAS